MKCKKIVLLIIIELMLIGLAGTSQAALFAVSTDPVTGAVLTDPSNGFPLWYEDSTTFGLVPCLTETPATPTTNLYCVLLSDPGFNASLPVLFPTNFPIEFFYWIADATGLPAGVKVMRFAVEGSFPGIPPVPTAGQQTVFQRIRMRITPTPNNPPIGNYTVTHPFGVQVFTPADIDPRKGFFNLTIDVPLATALDFTSVLGGAIGPFLKWDTGLPLFDPAGNQYIGNPLIPHTVTGSPLGNNFVQIDGPNIGGPGINTVRTNLFTVAGKIFNGVLPTPMAVTRTTYSRDALGGGQVDVFADSVAGASLSITGGPNFPAGPVAMEGDSVGSFFRSVIAAPNALTLPPTLTITANSTTTSTSTIAASMTDVVTISKAEYNDTTGTLTVEAFSSDQSYGGIPGALPTLTALGQTLAPVPLASPLQRLVIIGGIRPPSVTVQSIAGGSHTLEPVIVVGAATALSISGTVTDSLGAPLAGVILTLSGAGTQTVLTDVAGNYSFGGLANGTYTVTAALSGFTFAPTPPNTGVVTVGPSAVGVNFTGTFVGYTISGTVRLLGAGQAGVTMTLTQGVLTMGTALTDAAGAYSFTGLAAGTYTVTPSLLGSAFTPLSTTLTVGPNASAVDFVSGFSISGNVALGLAGQAGVVINLSSGGLLVTSTLTDAAGNYIFTGVAPGAYTVTPALVGFVYTPLSAPVTVGPSAVGVNFSATIANLSISGRVTVAGVGQGGVSVTATSGGVTVATATTAADGTFSLIGLIAGAYTVTPVKAGFMYTPPSSTLTISASVTGVAFTGSQGFIISGIVKSSVTGALVPGVTITMSGAANMVTTTGLNGSYSFTVPNGVYSLVPSMPRTTFLPSFRTVTINNGSVLGQNFRSTP